MKSTRSRQHHLEIDFRAYLDATDPSPDQGGLKQNSSQEAEVEQEP